MTLKSEFRRKYVYKEAKETRKRLTKGTFNIALFGLHERAGNKLFEGFLPGNIVPTTTSDGNFRVKEFQNGNGRVQLKAIVNTSQYAVESFFTAAVGALQCYDESQDGIGSFVVVFDASFIRFSWDSKRAMALMEEMFGPTVWDNTALVILNSDDVLEEGTIDDYLHREGNEDLRHYAEKLGGGVMALPSHTDDYSLDFQKQELLNIIKKNKEPYQKTMTTNFRFVRYRIWVRLYGLLGWTL